MISKNSSQFQLRTVHIGACLPSSCSEEDLRVLGENSASPLDTRATVVTGIRIPGGDGYKLWEDGTFITML